MRLDAPSRCQRMRESQFEGGKRTKGQVAYVQKCARTHATRSSLSIGPNAASPASLLQAVRRRCSEIIGVQVDQRTFVRALRLSNQRCDPGSATGSHLPAAHCAENNRHCTHEILGQRILMTSKLAAEHCMRGAPLCACLASRIWLSSVTMASANCNPARCSVPSWIIEAATG
jgi:hypothetical protein